MIGVDSEVSRVAVVGTCDWVMDITMHLFKAPTFTIWPRCDCRYHRMPVMDFVLSCCEGYGLHSETE